MRDPVVAEGRATWVRFFAPGHFTRSAVLTPEMDVDVNAGIHRCGYQMRMWLQVSVLTLRGLRTLEVRVVLVSKFDRRGVLEAFREALLEIGGSSFDVIEGR